MIIKIEVVYKSGITEQIEFEKINDKWEGHKENKNEAFLIIKEKNNNQFIIKNPPKEIDSEATVNRFLESYLELRSSKEEVEASGVEFEEENIEIDTEENPYDPELIRVDPRMFSIKYVLEMLNPEDKEEEVKINLKPDFQRNFVWNDITRKSRLIESLLLRIPLPVFYMASDTEGNFAVVDGVQRLTVINDFYNGKFPLKNLEYLKECENKYFKQLKGNGEIDEEKSIASKYRNRMFQTQLIWNVIDPQTPSKVKFDIFRRINTGGKSLNNQEIRNCLAKNNIRKYIEKLAKAKEFKAATDNSVKSIRLDDEELVLRFIGFYCSKKNYMAEYRGNMTLYLDQVLDFLNRLDTDKNYSNNYEVILKEIENDFINSMKIINYSYGKYAFRKMTEKKKRTLINKSLFLVKSILFTKVSYEKITQIYSNGFLIEPTFEKLKNDTDLLAALTTGTNDVSKLEMVFKSIENFLVDKGVIDVE